MSSESQSLSEYTELNKTFRINLKSLIQAKKQHNTWEMSMKTFTDKIKMLYISDDEDSANLHIKSISYVFDDEHMSEQTTNLQSQCSLLLTSSFIQVKSY